MTQLAAEGFNILEEESLLVGFPSGSYCQENAGNKFWWHLDIHLVGVDDLPEDLQ